MSIVSAYVDLPKGEGAPMYSLSCWAEGELNATWPEGLDVTWWDAVPESAQVYIEWTPRVFAVWEEEEIGDEHGTEVEQPGSGNAEEVDGGVGQGGEGAGEGSGTGSEEPVSAE